MGDWKKCANPDCIRMCKRHKRCGTCRRNSIYICQDCKIELTNDKPILCPPCYEKRHTEYQRIYREQIRNGKLNSLSTAITN